jgi:four helix bundle protein
MDGKDAPHKRLKAWQLSIELVKDVYKLTQSFPKEEMYGLTSQMRRAAISIPSNIAEGAIGRTKKHFASYLLNSIGSIAELDTQIEIAQTLEFITNDEEVELIEKLNRVKALTLGLKNSLQKK